MSATCYVTDDKMTQHWNILTSWFPETPLRLEVAQRLLESRGLLDRCVILETRQATDEELALVHTKEHIERIRATEKMTLEEVTLAGYDIDPVTIMGQASNESARIAAGCLLQVIDAVAGGKCRNGVALIRPPGHHSSWDTVLGFCIFNNAAIAAKYAIQKHGLKRVMILDWDVHHGNGTQQIFYEDNSVLYVSLHRYSHEKKIFPFLDVSDASYVGEGVGKGYNVNVPWTKPAMTDADYLTAMCQLIMPIAIEYDPELVIVSAGFDSAKGDIMGDCCVTPAGYQHMTSLLKNLARGKVVIQLEGGYNVDVVAECLAACMGTLLGDPCLPVSNMKPSTSALASIEKARSALAPYWKCLTPEGHEQHSLASAESTADKASPQALLSERAVSSSVNSDPGRSERALGTSVAVRHLQHFRRDREEWLPPMEDSEPASAASCSESGGIREPFCYHVSSMAQYKAMYQESIEDPAGFWGKLALKLYWKVPPTRDRFMGYNFDPRAGPVRVCWMQGAITNACFNVLDRHVLAGHGSKVAYYWEGNNPKDKKVITYEELLNEVCKFSNVLKSKGVCQGHLVSIYLPMVPELVVAMLACARLGAVHTVVFAGYSAESLAQRIFDTQSRILVTADGSWRGKKLILLKPIADEAITICKKKGHVVESCIVLRHLMSSDYRSGNSPSNGTPKDWQNAERPDGSIYSWWHEEMQLQSNNCDVVWVDAEDPLFLLYTSGSTGRPKGVIHTTGGYLLYALSTVYFTFDYRPEDVFFCTADIGWVTGHTHVVYGVLANGATNVLFEGIPFYPDPGRLWDCIDYYQVTKFYTAPTAIRALMKYGDAYVRSRSRKSLKILGIAGEPIGPDAWFWYHHVVGECRGIVLDTYWQTETGGQMITPLPGCTPLKPGAATLPFFGVVLAILDPEGKEIKGPGEGYLVIKKPWPGMMRTLYKDHDRFQKSYFTKFPGYYFTGDGAMRDEDGYYWITGRVDDMLNVSGHLISTAQVESALLAIHDLAEAAAVPRPHKVKGQCLYCYVVLKDGKEFCEDLKARLKQSVRSKIGAFADPEYIHCVERLPKTRSGKVMRRILRKIACNELEFGDVSALSEQDVISELLQSKCFIQNGSSSSSSR